MSDCDDVEETDGSDEGTADPIVKKGSFALVERRLEPPPGGLLIFDGFLTGGVEEVLGPPLDGEPLRPTPTEVGDEADNPGTDEPVDGGDADTSHDPADSGEPETNDNVDDEGCDDEADEDPTASADDSTEADPVADVSEEEHDTTDEDDAQEVDDDPT